MITFTVITTPSHNVCNESTVWSIYWTSGFLRKWSRPVKKICSCCFLCVYVNFQSKKETKLCCFGTESGYFSLLHVFFGDYQGCTPTWQFWRKTNIDVFGQKWNRLSHLDAERNINTSNPGAALCAAKQTNQQTGFYDIWFHCCFQAKLQINPSAHREMCSGSEIWASFCKPWTYYCRSAQVFSLINR